VQGQVAPGGQEYGTALLFGQKDLTGQGLYSAAEIDAIFELYVTAVQEYSLDRLVPAGQ
jgi:hypothetical protein